MVDVRASEPWQSVGKPHEQADLPSHETNRGAAGGLTEPP